MGALELQIRKLCEEGSSISEISTLVEKSESVVTPFVTAYRQGCESYKEYRERNAKKQGYASYRQYVAQVIEEKGYASMSDYKRAGVRKLGFASITAYNIHLADRRGQSVLEYHEALAKRKGYKSLSEYKEAMLKKRGYQTFAEYAKHRDAEKSKLPKYQAFAAFLAEHFPEGNRAALREELGVSKNMMYRYFQGWAIPKKKVLRQVFAASNTQFRSIDDLLEKYPKAA